ncbi:MAG: DegT/DnrJ/EryC1/StrS family aminotransferase [Methanobrevibacter sp.]|nr:DegT/DnrJ/EryC1/StrS family aminotransferase [Candidatus Methanoflexus mossambicus]
MNKFEEAILVTKPIIPSLKDLNPILEDIFAKKWVTNHGEKHNLFENRLKEILKVKNVSVFNNGTIALLTALKALDLPLGSEVITTPFTFAATPHAISWNNLNPVFCDIEPNTMTIDPSKIEEQITDNTSAILPVHVYGFPCDVDKIDKIAKKHDLKVIYDGAHVFSSEIDGVGIGNFGDITMFSFHATKLFNSIEGGCLSYNNDGLRDKIYNLRNFGIIGEEEVVDIGINGKMNEIQAAIGLLNLDLFEEEKNKRMKVRKSYIENLKDVEGIRIPKAPKNVTLSTQYFPIVIEDNFNISRDELYNRLKEYNVYTRKYFYPICSDFEPYKVLKSSSEDNLPIANDIKNKVLCLPFYGELNKDTVDKICEIIKESNYHD